MSTSRPPLPPDHPLAAGHPPAWACGWGHDQYGPFADLAVGRVKQRFRWCPPGRFLMGSPEHELGRYSDEGPQHEVTLTSGFWMADSPVTQGLYFALMGTNPSRFADRAHPNRPVEEISLDRANDLCAALEERLQRGGLVEEGLLFRLPSEAEWEYACRAGTIKATYGGDLTLRGENDAPVLDPIAWYGGNSGVRWDFGSDIGRGVDSGGWPEKQHPHSRAGTRVVRQKAPNSWGLYDTLGNVWELCADTVSVNEGYPVDAAKSGRVDPVGTSGPECVSRGGCWRRHARGARAASRLAAGPNHDGILGLRLSRGRAHPTSQPQSQEPEQG
jgi:sulfatase modifying factor 1